MGTERAGWRSFWGSGGWWKAVILVIAYLALYQLVSRWLSGIFAPSIDAENVLATPASVFLGLGVPLLVGAALLVAFTSSVGWFRPIFSRQPVPGSWWMWIAVVLVAVPIVLRFIGIDYGLYTAGVVATTLAIGLLIGFVEELLYRGLVIKVLRDGGQREWSVAVVSSLLFALSHSINLFTGQPVLTVALTVVFTFGFGLMMYLVLRATGSIIWPMLLHGLTDPTTMLAVGGVDVATTSAHSPALELAQPFNIVFVVAALIAVFFIRSRRPSPSTS